MATRSGKAAIDRREFLLSGLAAASWPVAARPVASGPDAADVIVVGAGLSGMNAALQLRAEGLTVLVLEASARPGGRVFTVPGQANVLEFGASTVGRTYARVRDACSRYGVAIDPGERYHASPSALSINGALVRAEDWPTSGANRTLGEERAVLPIAYGATYLGGRSPLRELDDWLKPESAALDVSVRRFLEPLRLSPEALRLMPYASMAWSLDAISALTLLQETCRQGPDGQRQPDGTIGSGHIRGGSSRFPEALATALGPDLHTGTPVLAVENTRAGVRVRARGADGGTTTLSARFAVLAMPAPLAGRLLGPGAPEPIRRACAIPYATTVYAHLEILEPFWEKDGLPASLFMDGAWNMCLAWTPAGGSEPRLLRMTALGGAGSARYPRTPAGIGAEAIDVLARARPSTRGRVRALTGNDWQQQPFAAGCRHMPGPGQVLGALQRLKAPFGRVYFAGEHLRHVEYGMEAAMESGERAALAILERA